MGTQNEQDTPLAFGLRDLRSPDLPTEEFSWKGKLDSNQVIQDQKSNQPEKRLSGNPSITSDVLTILQPSSGDFGTQSFNYDKAKQAREALKSIRKRDTTTPGPNLVGMKDGVSIGLYTNSSTPKSQECNLHGRDSIMSVGVMHSPSLGGDISPKESNINEAKRLKTVQDELTRQNDDQHLQIKSAKDGLVQRDGENQINDDLNKFNQYSQFIKAIEPTLPVPKYPPRAECKNFNSKMIFEDSDRGSQALEKQTIGESPRTGHSYVRTSSKSMNSGRNSDYQHQRKSLRKTSSGSHGSGLDKSQNAPSENNPGSSKRTSGDLAASP